MATIEIVLEMTGAGTDDEPTGTADVSHRLQGQAIDEADEEIRSNRGWARRLG